VIDAHLDNVIAAQQDNAVTVRLTVCGPTPNSSNVPTLRNERAKRRGQRSRRRGLACTLLVGNQD
jgi:hypothetical protein